MNIADAAYATVHDYPGGSESLAPRLGMIPAVLRNKVNPNNESHRLALDEAARIMAVTNDARMLSALFDHLGYVCVQLPAAPDGSDMALLDGFLGMVSQFGEFATEFNKDWSDGRIDPKELSRLRQRFCRMLQSGLGFMHRIEALAE